RRSDYFRTESNDGLCRTASDKGNDASGFAQRISNRRISRRARLDRHDRPSQTHARHNQPVARLLLAHAVNGAGGSRARWTGKPERVGVSGGATINYKEALAWLYSRQRFGIKHGLENICRLRRPLASSCSPA